MTVEVPTSMSADITTHTEVARREAGMPTPLVGMLLFIASERDVLRWALRLVLQRPRRAHRGVGTADRGARARDPADRPADHDHPHRLELHDAVRGVGDPPRRPARDAQLDAC